MTDSITPDLPDAPQTAPEPAAPEHATPETPQAASASAAPAAPEAAQTAPEAAQTAPEPATPEPATPEPAAPAPATSDQPQAANPWAVPSETVAPAKPRRPLNKVWLAAGTLLLVTFAATTVAMCVPDRTDVPGLATPNDGRYSFAPLVLPPLPSGSPAPDDDASHGRHYADLRQLLLPAPKGVSTATADWVPCATYAARYQDGDKATALLVENACRAATTRVWTAPDGTRTELWLVRFGSRAEAGACGDGLRQQDLKDAQGLEGATFEFGPNLSTAAAYPRFSSKTAGPGGTPVARVAQIEAGDVLATVVMTNPHGVPAQAYKQVTLLQDSLLRADVSSSATVSA